MLLAQDKYCFFLLIYDILFPPFQIFFLNCYLFIQSSLAYFNKFHSLAQWMNTCILFAFLIFLHIIYFHCFPPHRNDSSVVSGFCLISPLLCPQDTVSTHHLINTNWMAA
jgi:hypothetical protein